MLKSTKGLKNDPKTKCTYAKCTKELKITLKQSVLLLKSTKQLKNYPETKCTATKKYQRVKILP